MHRIRLLLAALLLTTVGWLMTGTQAAAQPAVTITSPTANSQICASTTISIAWTTSGGATTPFGVVVTNLSTSTVVLVSGPVPSASNPTSWTTPAVAAPGVTFSITVTANNGGGGSVSTTTLVQVTPAITMSVPLAAQSICSGNTSGTFSSTVAGGTGTRTWNNGIIGTGSFGGIAPTISSGTANSFTIGTTNVGAATCVAGTAGATGGTYGTYSVTQVTTDGGCQLTSTTTLTVNRTADPTLTFSANPVCAGQGFTATLGFTGNSFGAYSYTLTDPCGVVRASGSGTSTGSIANVVVNITAATSMQGTWSFAINSTATPSCGTKTCTGSLTVNAPPTSISTPTTSPSPATVCQGTTVTFSANITGSQNVNNFVWRRNGVNLANGPTGSGATISGASGAISQVQGCAGVASATVILTITNIQTAECGNYDVVVTPTAPCVTPVTSATATATVYIPSSFVTNPTSQLLCSGGNATFTASLNAQPCAGAGVGFQWQKRCPVGSGAFTPIPGATGSSYTIVNVQVTDVGDYQVVTTGNPCGVASSSIATLTVFQTPASATITPSLTSMCRGSSMTFFATPTSSSGNIVFQYQTQQQQPAVGAVTPLGAPQNQLATMPSCINQNGVAGPNSIPFTPGCGGRYDLIAQISSFGGLCGTNTFTLPNALEVNDPASAPTLTGNTPVCIPGGILNLTAGAMIECVPASGIGWARSINYSIFRSTVNLATNPAPGNPIANPANYTVVGSTQTGPGGTITNSTTAPAFLSGLQSQAFSNVTLPITTGTFRYAVVISTGGTLACAPVTQTFDVVVNSWPQISFAPPGVGSRTICQGNNTTFDVTVPVTNVACTWTWAGPNGGNIATGTIDAAGNATVNFDTNATKYLIGNRPSGSAVGASGTTISGTASGVDLTVTNAQTTDAGTYTLSITNSCGTTTTSPVLTVNLPPTIVVSNQSLCNGQTSTISANITSGTGPFTYRWYRGGTGVIGSGTDLTVGGTTGSGTLPSGSNYSGANTTTLTITSAQVADAGQYYLEVTPTAITPAPPNAVCGTVRSAAVNVTITAPPSGLAMADVTTCVGNTFSLVVTGNNLTGSTGYAWYKGGTRLLAGGLGGRVTSANSTLTITNAVATDAGTYTLRAANAPCDSAQVTAQVIVNTPTTLVGPGNQTVCSGTNVTLTVTASGTGPFTYQWRKGTSPGGVNVTDGPTGNGSTASGSSNQSLTINNVQPGDAGTYYVRVSNASGCSPAQVDLNPPITLTVNSAPSLSQIYDTTVCENQTTIFNANPSSAGTPAGAFVWKKNGTVINSGATGNGSTYNISGAQLTITNTKAADAGTYSVSVKNVCDSVTVMAKLTVNIAPTLVLSGNQKVCKGRTATFTAAVSGTGPFTYQWTKGGGSIIDGPTLWGSQITGTKTQTLTITNCDPQDNGQYILTVTGVCGPAAQNGLSLTVVTPPQLSILSPHNLEGCKGDNITFDVQATGTGNNAGGQLDIVWEGPNGKIDSNSAHYDIRADGDLIIYNITAADEGLYKLTVIGVCDPNPTAAFDLKVNQPPTIVGQPITISVCPGNPATFIVTATGDQLTYQWYKNGQPITGATSPNYTISPAAVSDEGDYHVVVSGKCPPSATSNTVKLQVGRAPLITQGPRDTTLCPGGTANFSVVVGGTGLTYQWRKNGAPIPGANSTSLQVTNVTAGDEGSYDCVVSLPCAPFVASNTARLTVGVAPQITQDLNNGATFTICEGTSQSFAITATGTALTYQWFKDGTAIPAAVSNSYTVAGATAANAGRYKVTVKGLCGTVDSKEVTLAVNAATRITQDPSPQSACEGSTVTFTAAATGTAITYQWQKNGVNIPGATNATYTTPALVSADNGALYRCVITGACDPKQLITKEVEVTLKRVIVGTLSAKIDTTEIGATGEADLIFTNNGQSDVTVSSVSQLAAPFSIVSVTPNVPTTLKPSQSITVRVRFTPTEPGVKVDTVKMRITDPCEATAIAVIQATGDDRKAFVELRILDMTGSVKSASPVDMVVIYAVDPPVGFNKVTPSTVDMEIAFNASMLTPVDETIRAGMTFKKTSGIPVGDTAIMKIHVNNVPSSGVVTRIPMYVLLGNDSITPLMFHSVPTYTAQGNGKIFVTNTINGVFTATDYCSHGDGLRGTNPGRLGLVKLAPNPAITAFNMAYTANGPAVAKLYDMRGNEVTSMDLPYATTGGISEATMNVGKLPTGMYLLVIQSNGETVRQLVSIVK